MVKLDNLVVSSSPHLRSGEDVEKMMWHVNLALLPAVVLSVYYFGFRALAIIVFSIAAAVATEAIIQKATGKDIYIADGSSSYRAPVGHEHACPCALVAARGRFGICHCSGEGSLRRSGQ